MSSILTSPYVLPILLLLGSNIFMTLGRRDRGQLGDCFRRILHGGAGQSLGQRDLYDCSAQDDPGSGHASRFAGFSILYLKEPMTWNYAIGFALVAAGAYFIFRGPL